MVMLAEPETTSSYEENDPSGRNRISIDFIEWAKPLLERDKYRHKVLYGGRGSGKSWQVGIALLVMAAKQRLRILCARELQVSIDASNKRLLSDLIVKLGMEDMFTVTRSEIRCDVTGSLFIFHGLSGQTAASIKSIEGIDICWVEEAQKITQSSIELLTPSIRKPSSEIWWTFNPEGRDGPVYRRFISSGADQSALIINVNYYDNPYFNPDPDTPSAMELDRAYDLKYNTGRYAHIWLGKPDDGVETQHVLPYTMAEKCVDAIPAHKGAGIAMGGFDVADLGRDKSCFAVRRGPNIMYVESWSAELKHSVSRVDRLCRRWDVKALYYDVGGMGAGVKGFLEYLHRDYSARPTNFGAKVRGGDRKFTAGTLNRDYFLKYNGQLAWGLRMRAMMTARLLDGEDVNPEHCLNIQSRGIHDLDRYLLDLTQPVWDDSTGRIKITKDPDEKGSPDMYDATVLAFARDSRSGLRLH